MRFHVVGLPHTHTNTHYCTCAYTMKVYNFCRMMKSLGHYVYHYGGSKSDTSICNEHITVRTDAEDQEWFGSWDPFKTWAELEWDSTKPYWQVTNERSADEISKRLEHGDFIGIIGGCCNQPLTDSLVKGFHIPVEYGIGYYGTYLRNRVFESYAQQNVVHGRTKETLSGSAADVVIPNYFDPEMFPVSSDKEDYILFIGRLIREKGINTAVEVSRMTGKRLLVAGQGAVDHRLGYLKIQGGQEYRAPGLTYVGVLDTVQRAKVMGEASAVLVPTVYVEPFGGVSVEAQMTGTPVVTTNRGAFPEIVEHGKTGYRCHSLEQFVWATRHVNELDRNYIRKRAITNWSMWNIRHKYQAYFEMLHRDMYRVWRGGDSEHGNAGWNVPSVMGSGYYFDAAYEPENNPDRQTSKPPQAATPKA